MMERGVREKGRGREGARRQIRDRKRPIEEEAMKHMGQIRFTILSLGSKKDCSGLIMIRYGIPQLLLLLLYSFLLSLIPKSALTPQYPDKDC